MSLALYASPYDNNGIDNSTDNLISKKRLNHNKTQKYHNRDRDNSTTSNTSEKVRNLIKSIHDNNDIDGVDMGDFTPIPHPNSAGVERTIDRSTNLKESYTGINDNSNNSIKNSSSDYNTSSNLNQNQNQSQSQNSSSNYYNIPTANNNNYVSGNDVNASNYLDSMEKNNLTYNYVNDKDVEEYYKKYVPNYNYGSATNINRNIKPNHNINNTFPSNQSSSNFSPYTPSFNSSTENSVLIDKLNYMIHLLEEQHDERTANVTEEVVLYCFLGVFMIFIVDSFTRVGKYVR
jgi:hypothetical protein